MELINIHAPPMWKALSPIVSVCHACADDRKKLIEELRAVDVKIKISQESENDEGEY